MANYLVDNDVVSLSLQCIISKYVPNLIDVCTLDQPYYDIQFKIQYQRIHTIKVWYGLSCQVRLIYPLEIFFASLMLTNEEDLVQNRYGFF